MIFFIPFLPLLFLLQPALIYASPPPLLALPVDSRLTISSFLPEIARLFELNREGAALFPYSRAGLIRERLGGFDPGADYRCIGGLIRRNYTGITIENLIELIENAVAQHPHQFSRLIRSQLVAFHLSKILPEPQLQEFFQQQQAARSLISNLIPFQQGSNYVVSFLPHLRIANQQDALALLPYILHNIDTLLPPFIAFFLENYSATANSGMFLFSSFIKSILLRVHEIDIDGFFEIIDQIEFTPTAVNFLVEEIYPEISDPLQVDFFRRLLRTYPIPHHLRMPLTVILTPENWPPRGTWPAHFNITLDEPEDLDIDYQLIIRRSFLLSRLLNRPEITVDIVSEWLREPNEANRLAIIVATGHPDQIHYNELPNIYESILQYSHLALHHNNQEMFNAINRE